MELIHPNSSYQRSYSQYITELGDEERYPFPLDFEYADFAALLDRLNEFRKGIKLPKGYVPSSTYWLVDKNELIGVSNLRHFLNDNIRESGGHIGLGIRPSYRGKGLGSLLMALTLEKAKAKGINEVHVHCYKENKASAAMIIANKGELESEIQDSNSDELIQRYICSI